MKKELPYKITFIVRNPETQEIDEEGYINLANPQRDIVNLLYPDEIVLAYQNAILILDYPFSVNLEYEISSKSSLGFTLRELLEVICEKYRNIYAAAENSQKGSKEREVFCITVKELFHYDLTDIHFNKQKDGKIMITLSMDS